MILDEAQLRQVVTVCELHLIYSDVLSAFEVETLWAVNERALEHGPATPSTEAEWAIVLGAHSALVDASRRRKAPMSAQLAHAFIGDAIKFPQVDA